MIAGTFEDEGVLERGFIKKEDILKSVTEEEIFELVFGYLPKEYELVTSPFREDNHPGCWFERDLITGKLLFKDFANNGAVNGIRLKVMDCFNTIQVFFNLPDFYRTLVYIKENVVKDRNLDGINKVETPQIVSMEPKRKKVKIFIATREFEGRDKRYWEKYGIGYEDLREDRVFPVAKYKVTDSRKGDFVSKIYDLCYAYTEFQDGRKKLYRPLKKGKNRFIGTALADDVGGFEKLLPFGRQLIIAKAYKDYRVLKNLGLNTVWFQSEVTIPSTRMLTELCNRFESIVIFYDSDKRGIEGSRLLKEKFDLISPNKARRIWLSEVLLTHKIKDASDLYRERGRNNLIGFLKEMKVL